MKKRTAWLLAAGVAAVAVGAAAVGVVALAVRGQRSGHLPFAGSSYLQVDLEGTLPEQSPAELGSFFERKPPSLRTLVEALDRGARDAAVKGLVLRVGFLHDAGWGRIQELRSAIERFRKSGKPAYAHLDMVGNKEYYLASACNKVYALPSALILVTGLDLEVTFFARTLEKIGVEADFVAVGKYKSAPEAYTRPDLSEPNREQLDAVLDSLYDEYVQSIASARKKTPEEVQAILDGGPYDGPSALAAGLVDKLMYFDQIEDELDDAKRISPARYARSSRGLGLGGRPRIALVYAVGEIVSGRSLSSPLGGTVAGSDTVAGALRRAREDSSIKAIVLRVDSPGGSGTASEEIWREASLARQQKPLIVSMGDYAASGGYYISMPSDGIVAQPGTITGSIGVFSGKLSLRDLYEKVGLTREILARGERASMYSEYRSWTEDERERMRELMTTFYRDFVTKAAQGRKKSYDEIDAVAQGRVWTGAQAVEQGLVDRLGGLEAAVGLAKERAHLAASQEVALVVLPEPRGFLETLLDRQDDLFPGGEAARLAEAIPADLRAALSTMRTLASGQPLARMPFALTIR